MTDARRFAPPAQRNRDPIADILRTILPQRGLVLTIAEGTGEHAVHFARIFPHLTFQPTDPDPGALASIAAWTAHEGLENILPPLALDASLDEWPVEKADAIMCINMIHISPWAATEGLMRGAARVLTKGGTLYLYGPYRRDGKQTSQSNEKFEGWLKSLSPDYGVRDLAEVTACAARNGFGAPEIIDMPANNFSVVFQRG
ncbi:MAG: DUF938 domain-containing protein [Hyphomicrobiales bacterium]|nr:DUF938 domain-containing protein [Hyphomicrobiales bacterium]